MDSPGNILEPENAKAYYEAAVDSEDVHDPSGYEIVSLDDLNAVINTTKYTFDVFEPAAGSDSEGPEKDPESAEQNPDGRDESKVSPHLLSGTGQIRSIRS